MSSKLSRSRNRIFVLGGLVTALLIAMFLTPFASKNPDGLDRVSKDLKFDTQESQNNPAHKLPFSVVFDEYAAKGVPQPLATPLAGLAGTFLTFGLAWGLGKLTVRGASAKDEPSKFK